MKSTTNNINIVQITGIIAVILSVGCIPQTINQLFTKKNSNRGNEQIFKSSKNSFRQDYYLIMKEDSMMFYGWEISESNDTIYYRSKNIVQYDSLNRFNISFEEYELTSSQFNSLNIDESKVNKNLKVPAIRFYSSFSGWFGKDSESIELIAVKHIYLSRFDEFEFNRITKN